MSSCPALQISWAGGSCAGLIGSGTQGQVVTVVSSLTTGTGTQNMMCNGGNWTIARDGGCDVPQMTDGDWCHSVNGKVVCDQTPPPQPTPQIGDPLFSKIIEYWDTDPVYNLQRFNSDMENAIRALNSDWATNPIVIAMRSSCHINESTGNLNAGDASTRDYCGRYACYARNGVVPFMNILRDSCNGHDPNCAQGHFAIVYDCLNSAQ